MPSNHNTGHQQTDVMGQMVEWHNILPLEKNKSLRHPAQRLASAPPGVDSLLGDDIDNIPAGGQRIRTSFGDIEGTGIDGEEFSDLDDFVIDDDGAGYVSKRKDMSKKSGLPAKTVHGRQWFPMYCSSILSQFLS